MAWWLERLHVDTAADLDDSLARVEKLAREYTATHAGKTTSQQVGTLHAFCGWCVRRRFLKQHPLTGMAPFNTEAETRRRALTPDEIGRLLAVSPPDYRLTFETALCTGLRKRELRLLQRGNLDADAATLHVDAATAKNRNAETLPVPPWLADSLR